MVLLLERLGHSLGFHSKLENHHHHHHHHLFHHHHHQSEALSASLEAFRSDVTNSFNQLLSNSKPESETLSLSWIHHSFELFPMINKAFTKLLVDIEYPFSKWEAASIEEYLSYSLNLLELLNSITSSVSHLGQSRLSLSHALSLVEHSPSLAIERLKPIEPAGSFSQDCNIEKKGKDDGQERSLLGKELVIHQALMVIKSIGYWVCGIILSSLSGDDQPSLELNKLANGLETSLLIGLNSSTCGEIMEKRGDLKEVKEVNDAVACLVDSTISGEIDEKAAEELGRRLEVLEKLAEGVGKEVDHLFAKVLAGRNELLDSLRQQHKVIEKLHDLLCLETTTGSP